MTNVRGRVGLGGLCELGQTPLPRVKLSEPILVVGVRIHATDATQRRPSGAVADFFPEPLPVAKAPSATPNARVSAPRGRYSPTFDANGAGNPVDCDESLTACVGIGGKQPARARDRHDRHALRDSSRRSSSLGGVALLAASACERRHDVFGELVGRAVLRAETHSARVVHGAFGRRP